MSVQQMHHVGVVVDDLAGAIAFFVELGLELDGRSSAQDPTVDRIVGLDGVHTDFAFVRTPDGRGALELIQFHAPPYDGPAASAAPANAPGIRHLAFAVDDLDAVLARLQVLGAELVGSVEQYGDTYRLCYLRGPAGIIVELAERVA